MTVFDISEDNKKYALEVAAAANVHINYEVGDVLDTEPHTQFLVMTTAIFGSARTTV